MLRPFRAKEPDAAWVRIPSACAQGHDDANLRLVRFFGICLGSLVFVYSLLAVRLFLDGSSFEAGDWALIALRVLLGAAALVVMFYPAVAGAPAGEPHRRDGPPVRGRLRRHLARGKDPPDRAGDDGEPAARARHDPLARLGLPGIFLLQELHAARLLPRPRRRLRRCGQAALRARAGAADARAALSA